MNERQRFLETLLFGKPDRIPFAPGGPRESTLRAWYTQGLPERVNWHSHLLDTLGIVHESHGPRVGLDVSFRMIPTFQEKVLKHQDGHYVVQDWMGAITEISDEYDYTYIRAAKDFVTRKWHRFPVTCREEWEAMKSRFDPGSPGRYPEDFEERCAGLRDRDYVIGLHFSGPFWQMREWCGMEGLCLFMADDPEFVDEMSRFYADFVSTVMRPVLEKVQLDYVHYSEDMAFKAHSMISPAMARRFLVPAYQQWREEIQGSGCPIIMMDSDGYIGDLIPIWMECGINCCDPVEVAAGNDIVEFRRLYGRRMAFRGGIDKRAIAKGEGVMRQEVMRVVSPLFKEGGYIPGCDHGVPPDISWPNFVEYARLLAELTGWV